MRRLKLYLDTSVLNFMFAEDELEKMKTTQRFFEEIQKGNFEVFISTLVIREIEEASEVTRSKLEDLVKETRPKILKLDEETEKLAELYVAHGIIPEKYSKDAIHIAVAVVNDLDVVVSWNLEHMVKVKTRIETNGINRLEGYHEIDISTPEEVI